MRYLLENKNRFGSLILLDNPKKFSSAGRNLGVKNSSAPYILILDGHINLPDKHLLSSIINVFEKINYMMYIKDDQSMVIYITEPINDNGYIIFAIIESIKGNIKFALSIKKDNYEKIYNLILSMLKTIVLKEFKILLDNIENILTKIDKFIQKL